MVRRMDEIDWSALFQEEKDDSAADEQCFNSVNLESKRPAQQFNPTTGEFEWADPGLRELAARRAGCKRIRDNLADKQAELKAGLGQEAGIGVGEDKLGKTGDSRTGEVTDEHRRIAASQVEDAKAWMLRHRKVRS